LFVCKCVLPPGDNPIAVNKYIILDGNGWSTSCPSRFTPGKDPVPIVQEADWAPRAGLDSCDTSRHPPGFDPRTVQPVARLYTDYAILTIMQILQLYSFV
jgi:hypothetical protein